MERLGFFMYLAGLFFSSNVFGLWLLSIFVIDRRSGVTKEARDSLFKKEVFGCVTEDSRK